MYSVVFVMHFQKLADFGDFDLNVTSFKLNDLIPQWVWQFNVKTLAHNMKTII